MEANRDRRTVDRWRLIRWGVALLTTAYLAAFSFYLVSSTSLGGVGGWGAYETTSVAVTSGTLLVALVIASARRRWGSPGVLLASSAAAAFALVAALHMGVDAYQRLSDGPYSLFSSSSLIAEVSAGYWPTLAALSCTVIFTLVHAESRALVDSLIPLPVLMWGLDSTRSHWLGFTALAHETSFFLQVFWLGTFVTTATLLGLIALCALWRARCGKRELELKLVVLTGMPVLAVYADWAFSLFVTSMMLIK